MVFDEAPFPIADIWEEQQVNSVIPAEAQGELIDVRLTQSSGKGWIQVDDVVLLIGGENKIVNGDFSVPTEQSIPGAIVDLELVPGWEKMGNQTTARLARKDGETYGETIGMSAPFGQTTAHQAKGGEELNLRLKTRSEGNTELKIELYYLDL